MKIKKEYISLHLVIAFAFFELMPLQIWTSKTSNKDISKTIKASSLRFGQLKEDGE